MQDLSSAIAHIAFPAKDGIPVTYGRTIEGNVSEDKSIEEVLTDEGSE